MREKEMETYEDQISAEIAAKNLARKNGRGFAYAIEWADHWSVENRKPSFRGRTSTGRDTLVIEVRDNGSCVFA
jgi:hypothetical protein